MMIRLPSRVASRVFQPYFLILLLSDGRGQLFLMLVRAKIILQAVLVSIAITLDVISEVLQRTCVDF
jgi:hypothetical protein